MEEKMIDYLLLKAQILVEGIRAENECLIGIGDKFKAQNHGLFGWDFETHKNISLPDDFILPDGTVVQFRLNSKSDFFIKNVNGKLILFNKENDICEVNWIKQPEFYTKKTSLNHEMVKVGQIGGEDCLFICYQNYCSHFSNNKQCQFCNLVATSNTYNTVLKKKDFDSIGEVTASAWSEGIVNHILLTGGCFSSETEVEIVTNIINSIKKHTGMNRIPGTILPSPAKGDNIKKYFDTGIKAIGYSMEIFDESLYKAICPGKSENTTHKEFLDSIKNAVSIFGEGNVYGVLVMGLETKDTFLEGVKTITDLGANVVPFVWSPNPGSKLSGHRAPFPEWYFETIQEAAEIVIQSKIPLGEENHCYKCDGNSLLHDAIRKKMN
jgi:biotin synthase-like enzyme